MLELHRIEMQSGARRFGLFALSLSLAPVADTFLVLLELLEFGEDDQRLFFQRTPFEGFFVAIPPSD